MQSSPTDDDDAYVSCVFFYDHHSLESDTLNHDRDFFCACHCAWTHSSRHGDPSVFPGPGHIHLGLAHNYNISKLINEIANQIGLVDYIQVTVKS